MVSGAAGLVDQVCFSRYLSYVVGSTAHAVSAVLAAFMTGIAVGATAGGRLSARMRRPIATYGIAEILVGASVALAPVAFAGLTPLYVTLVHRAAGSLALLDFLRWLVAFLFVAIPTAAMGATLPLVSAALASDDALPTRKRRLAILYAANTFGGAGGALIAAYALLPTLGLSTSVYLAAATSALAGLTALVIDISSNAIPAGGSSPTVTDAPASAPQGQLPLPPERAPGSRLRASGSDPLLAFPCGFLVFVLQALSTNLLVTIIGTSAQAFRLVLAAFLTSLFVGVALASRLSRRKSDRSLLYVLVLSSLPIAITLPFQRSLPLALGGLGVLVAFAFVVLPAGAVSATLPLVSVFIASQGGAPDPIASKRRFRSVCAVTLVAGVAGALSGAYLALPTLGLSTFVYSAAAAGAVAFVSVRAVERRAEPRTQRVLSGASVSPSWLAVLAVLSGFLVFAMEVVATHLLVVIIGNSTYAFGLILAAFLLFLFVGAALARTLVAETGDQALAYSLALSALAIALTLPLWDDMPLAFAGLDRSVTTFAGREAMRALIAFAILAVPATCMGFTFPLVLQCAAGSRDVGRLVGKFTTVNTAGAVVGALGTGYVVLPLLGSERTLIFVTMAFAGAAALTAARRSRAVQRGPIAASVVAIAGALLAPRWDLLQLTIGSNVYFDTKRAAQKLLHVREDVNGGVTTVAEWKGVHTLYTNGKFQGNDGLELGAQRYFAHYPCLFVRSFDDALIIGVGTGTTLGTLTAYPWKRIDVADLSPSIVEAAQKYFPHTNRRAFEDPRVHLTIADGRNVLLLSNHRYSIITMELTSVWFAGASNLYSSEYYRMVRDHLTGDGVFQQWVQLHHVTRPVFATLINTLRREFDHVALFYGGGQGILVASMRPLQWSRSRSARTEASPGFSEVLPGGRPLAELTDDLLLIDDSLDRFIADSAREVGADLATFVSNDDNLFLEYQTPRGNVLPWQTRDALAALVRSYRDPLAVAALATD
jgi:spermidine synthase